MGLLRVVGGFHPRVIQPMTEIRHGRAAHVRLVETVTESGTPTLCVEKVFRPGLLTKLIYRATFQAPFAYQHSREAVLACYYRRRVAFAIMKAMVPSVRIAPALYVRFDRECEAWVLRTQFVRGRGVLPAASDPYMVRRWLYERFESRRLGTSPPQEIDELLEVMTEVEELFRSTGLTGSGWQVCKRALVSTANFLRTDKGYVLVDLESGIPALLVPYYVTAGLRMGCLPLFDDIDAAQLTDWLAEQGEMLEACLGTESHRALTDDAQLLIDYTERWKGAELAVARNRWSVFGRTFRQRFKARVIYSWEHREIVDAQATEAMRPGSRIVSRLTFLLGIVPGRCGQFLQRRWANRPYRISVKCFLCGREFRQQQIRAVLDRRTHQWRAEGRINWQRTFRRFGPVFVMHTLFASLTPPGLHRWLTDRERCYESLTRMFLLCVSGRFQCEYGRHMIRKMIHRWQREERLDPVVAKSLKERLEACDLDEYVRCFGIHIGLKLFTPLLVPAKIGGVAANPCTCCHLSSRLFYGRQSHFGACCIRRGGTFAIPKLYWWACCRQSVRWLIRSRCMPSIPSCSCVMRLRGPVAGCRSTVKRLSIRNLGNPAVRPSDGGHGHRIDARTSDEPLDIAQKQCSGARSSRTDHGSLHAAGGAHGAACGAVVPLCHLS